MDRGRKCAELALASDSKLVKRGGGGLLSAGGGGGGLGGCGGDEGDGGGGEGEQSSSHFSHCFLNFRHLLNFWHFFSLYPASTPVAAEMRSMLTSFILLALCVYLRANAHDRK